MNYLYSLISGAFGAASSIGAAGIVVKLCEVYGGLQSGDVVKDLAGVNEETKFSFFNHLSGDSKQVYNYNEMKNQINMSAEITHIYCYKTFLTKDYSDETEFYHTFLIVSTNDGSYSIEKTVGGIFVRKVNSHSERIILDNRITIIETDGDVKNVTINDIMQYIMETELYITYSSLPRKYNCQAFSTRLIDFIVKMMYKNC